MAHTLVITGANFGTNKLDTVTFSHQIPCTGVSLDKSTITITSIATALFLGIATYAIANFVEKRFGERKAALAEGVEPFENAEDPAENA